MRLVLHISPGKVNTILYAESTGSEQLDTGDRGSAKVVIDSETTKTIEVAPLQLGELDVTVTTIYGDNSTGEQTVRLDVVPSGHSSRTVRFEPGFSCNHAETER